MTGCRAVRVPLGAGPEPAELVRRAAGRPGLVALVGDWAAASALLTCDPVRTSTDLTDLDAHPHVADAPDGFVGGGWFGRLDHGGTARFAFHDHVLRATSDGWVFEALWSDERDAGLTGVLAGWRALLAGSDTPAGWSIGAVTAPPRATHLAAVERAVELIRAGELYQVNVCTRLAATFAGSAAGLFADLAADLRPARGALLVDGPDALVALSPELFLAVDGRDARTAPIKGTLQRTGPADGNAERLRGSAKDAAENVMIVDLMRNDLGRVCEVGSVRVDSLLDVQAHPGVWHLVSAVSGRLRPDVGVAGLLRATFPPGSVTGAPKARATAVIAGLEAAARGAYTGAVGFVGTCGGAEFAVTIRAFEIAGGRLELGVGGGVTADSVPMLEWRECLHKAAPLLRGAASAPAEPLPHPPSAGLLETILVDDGVPVRLADHLARLDRSHRELTGHGLPGDLADRAAALAGTVPVGRAVLRVVVGDQGPVLTIAALGPPPGPGDAVVCARPHGLWRHKWADRAPLEAVERVCGSRVPLLVAVDGTVLETSRGNVFLVRPDGGLVTPPLRDDLLPGVTRRALLDLARDEGRPSELREFTVAELGTRPAFWTSSLSGVVAIRSVDGVVLPRADDVLAHLAIGIGPTR